RDHSEFLKRPHYANLFKLDKNDYVGWANGLKADGYATNPEYPKLLINIIEKYSLNQYDKPETPEQKEKREDRVITQIEDSAITALKDWVAALGNQPHKIANAVAAGKIYVVLQGDTLSSISRRFGVTVDELKNLNNMPDNKIKIGQKLVVSK